MIKNVYTFLTDTIFHKDVKEYNNPAVRWFVQQYKLLFYTAKGLVEHGTLVQSAALTFYTLMSLVPIVALVFAIVKGFGLTEMLLSNMYEILPQNKEIIDYIVDFANKAIERTQGGIVALAGIIILFWSVIKVFGSIESAFNNIWEVKITRSITRQYTDYISVVMIVPILWGIVVAMSSNAQKLLPFADDSLLYLIGSKLASMVVIWVMFSFLYKIIPNTKVSFSSSITAGIVAGTIFVLFQWGYIYIQQWMSSYNAIYGSFAALPLFLIWLQTSWQILLFGGELSFAYQNISRFAEERESLLISNDNRRKITIAIMIFIVRHFHSQGGGVSALDIRKALNLPTRIINELIHTLVKVELIIPIEVNIEEKERLFMPAKAISTMTLFSVIEALDIYGEQNIDFTNIEELNISAELLTTIKGKLEQDSSSINLIDL